MNSLNGSSRRPFIIQILINSVISEIITKFLRLMNFWLDLWWHYGVYVFSDRNIYLLIKFNLNLKYLFKKALQKFKVHQSSRFLRINFILFSKNKYVLLLLKLFMILILGVEPKESLHNLFCQGYNLLSYMKIFG